MKNPITTINSTQTVNNSTEKFQFKVSPFAIAMILAMVGIITLALNGIKLWIILIWIVPMVGLFITEAKSLFSMDFNFILDDDIIEEIHNDLWNA